ncbi:MAG: fimbrillin family protein [Bacteroidales bacterium]|nr:fimbrillin family protein [Bacteroidales bacterium]
MMKLKIFILLTLAALTACSGEAPDAPSGDNAVVGTPVMFTSGNQSLSRAIPYLGKDGRFVCRMYYQATQGSTDYTGQFQSWLRVNNAYGNSVYRNSLFNADENVSNLFDQFNFEKAATIFYWQNRKNHAFIAYTDLHRCFESSYRGDNGLNMTTDASFTEAENTYSCKKFLLTTSPTETLTEEQKQTGDPKYYSQPDPAVANTIMLPAGATQEANRVDLIFRHCFSQIQVNLKKAADGGINDLNAADITKVELLGVSQEGYIYFDADPTTGNNHDATYKKVVQSDFTAEELAANEFGTSMEMYDMGSDNYATGYVKSYRAIAFGQLRAIRITWKEDSGIEHIVTHKVVNLDSNDFINLSSGVRYIHNLELRRGTLAVIKTEILPWEIDEQQWNTSGIITEN